MTDAEYNRERRLKWYADTLAAVRGGSAAPRVVADMIEDALHTCRVTSKADRSVLLHMAGNIASGICANHGLDITRLCGWPDNQTRTEAYAAIAEGAVDLAREILRAVDKES